MQANLKERLCLAIGAAEAVAGRMKPGAHFLGAFQAADAMGYPRNGMSLERAVFITVYLDNLPRPIVTDRDGIIITTGK